jgi:hypothetical protein
MKLSVYHGYKSYLNSSFWGALIVFIIVISAYYIGTKAENNFKANLHDTYAFEEEILVDVNGDGVKDQIYLKHKQNGKIERRIVLHGENFQVMKDEVENLDEALKIN